MTKKAGRGRPANLDAALEAINKELGDGTIMSLGDSAVGDIECISTGSIALDRALGHGGLPCGRVTEIFGPEGSGKTTVALQAIANAQRGGKVAAFIDAEHALSEDYARAVGVDVDALLFSQPDSGEKGLVTADMLVRAGGVGIIVIDSVAALTPQKEIDGTIGDSLPGAQARLMAQGLRVITNNLTPAGPAVVFINQLREKIGVFFGNPETTPGGKALKFYASVRLDVRRVETLKDGAEAVGSRLRVKVAKNKVARPLRVAEFSLVFGYGIDKADELLTLGTEAGFITKHGTYYRFGDTQLGMGKDAARTTLREDEDLAAQLAKLVSEQDYAAPVPAVDATGEREVDASIPDGETPE